jgi:hypothetical protein
LLGPLQQRTVDFLNQTARSGFFSSGDADELRLLSQSIRGTTPTLYDDLCATIVAQAPCDIKVVRGDLNRLARILEVQGNIIQLSNNSEGDNLIPTFTLSSDDRQKILSLTREMRGVIHETHRFDDAHKERLLKAITVVEREVHRSVGRFDIVKGRVDEIGESLKRLGVNLKPLTDRATEVLRAVYGASNDVDLLPAPEEVKQLPPPDDQA